MTPMGIVSTIGLQAIINLWVVTGIFPTKGMSLPFISAGLSNLLLMGMLLGLGARAQCPQLYDYWGTPSDTPTWYSCSGSNFTLLIASPTGIVGMIWMPSWVMLPPGNALSRRH